MEKRLYIYKQIGCFDPASGQELAMVMAIMVDVMEMYVCGNKRRRAREVKTIKAIR